jgi:hypothetical protein
LWRSDAFSPLRVAPAAGSRLARFHANYGDDVLEAARRGEDAAGIVAAWIRDNPPRVSDAWHPYPTSTRIANWIAALTLEPSLGRPMGASLRLQLDYLARNVEYEILGNHLIRNAKALVLGGIAVGERRLYRLGAAILRRELPEQILPDGGHYERSPTYHRVVQRDLLEVAPFLDVGRELERMRQFAAASSRPDGSPALFNDGGLDLAPRLDLPPAPVGLALFADTGFAFLRRERLWLAFRCGPLAPRFLPAHAHADALSFQLWIDGTPLVVDPGTSTYEAGAQRDRDRSTAAHATVSVGGNQFELWGAFRAGPLPEVTLLEAGPNRLAAEVRLPKGITHRRTISIASDELAVHDELEGPGSHEVISSLPGTRAATPVGSLVAREETQYVAERFGEQRPVPALVQAGRVELPSALGWRIRYVQ